MYRCIDVCIYVCVYIWHSCKVSFSSHIQTHKDTQHTHTHTHTHTHMYIYIHGIQVKWTAALQVNVCSRGRGWEKPKLSSWRPSAWCLFKLRPHVFHIASLLLNFTVFYYCCRALSWALANLSREKNETAQVYALEEYVVEYQLSLDRKKFKHVATVSCVCVRVCACVCANTYEIVYVWSTCT